MQTCVSEKFPHLFVIFNAFCCSILQIAMYVNSNFPHLHRLRCHEHGNKGTPLKFFNICLNWMCWWCEGARDFHWFCEKLNSASFIALKKACSWKSIIMTVSIFIFFFLRFILLRKMKCIFGWTVLYDEHFSFVRRANGLKRSWNLSLDGSSIYLSIQKSSIELCSKVLNRAEPVARHCKRWIKSRD